MPALGSNINAALGRIDYSPIARGGESMARGIAQAGQVKGQTYASIGQNISQGIQKYQKNQLEKKEQEGARNMLEKALEDPRLANALNLSPGDDNVYDKGELNAVIASAGGREKLSAFLNQGQQMAAQQEQQVAQQKQQEIANKLDRDKLALQINQNQFNQGDATLGRTLQATGLGLQARGIDNAANRAPTISATQGRVDAGIAAFTEKNQRRPNAQETLEIQNAAAQAGVTQPGASQSAFGGAVGGGMGDELIEQYKAVETALQKIPELHRTLTLIEEGDARMGSLAEIQTTIDAFVGKFFDSEEARNQATDTQLLNAATGAGVFELIQSLGIGARGMDTPAERDFLREVMTGRITMTKESLIALTKKALRAQEFNVERWNSKTKAGTLDQFYKDANIPKAIYETPKRDSSVGKNISVGQYTIQEIN